MYGIDIIKNVISGSNNSLKPFGMVGYSGLNGIVYRLMLNNNYANRKRIYSFVTEHITKYLTEDIVTYLADKHSYVLLAEFSDVWNKHKVLSRWFYLLFSQLDKHVTGMGATRKVCELKINVQMYLFRIHMIS